MKNLIFWLWLALLVGIGIDMAYDYHCAVEQFQEELHLDRVEGAQW